MNSTENCSHASLRDHAAQACGLLKTLANEDRLLLLCALAETRKNVGELEQLTGVAQPSLSQQLGVLRNEGLVETSKEGRYVYYRIKDARAEYLMRALWELFCAPDAPSSGGAPD
ncbi:MAG: metalloregulator ArsR/SmtB family transcription factor [Zoogloeaceae bacterium]|jgi:DNA-binding transcriptional ArsR family regulator|nr:metalloregulator ArsR/SmtB family transcription factor [Zoogloeaceae bacterium]